MTINGLTCWFGTNVVSISWKLLDKRLNHRKEIISVNRLITNFTLLDLDLFVMRKLKFTISFYLLFVLSSFAQTFSNKTFLCDTCDRELSLHIESISFFKNNEYFNAFTKGFTGFGFNLKPTLDYYFTKNTKVSAGVYLLKYDGIDNFTQAIPILTIQQRLTPNLDLVLGSIYGTLNHQLEEPLFRFDRYYQNNVENGFQLLYHSAKIKSDLWLNWEKFIFVNSPYQEEFVLGNTNQFLLLQTKRLSIELPFHLMGAHRGGQIDSSPNPAISIVNAMSGLDIKYNIGAKQSLSFKPLLFLYRGLGLPETGVNSLPFSKGNGLYLKIHYQNKNMHSVLGYWTSNKFISSRGEYLFLSISDFDEGFSQEKRQLLTSKTEMQFPISESIKLVIRAEAYFDLMSLNFAHSFGTYFIINESFFLKKIKASRN